jgi:erythromycin esterase
VPAGVHEVSLEALDFSDLRFLAPLLSNVRIVQLGENGHGTAEATRLRVRIARYLCEQLGFGVLAFESSLFLCHLADVRAPETEPQRTLTASLVGVWHTGEMVPLFEAMRDWRRAGRRVHLAGFDVQPIGSNRKLRPAFFGDLLRAVDAEYAQTIVALDSEFLAAYDKGSSARREYLRANAERLSIGYERLALFISDRLQALQERAGKETPLVARQEARSIAAYVRFQSAADMRRYAEIRDEGMFENLRFLAADLFPGRKIIVWGHNYHLRHDNAAVPPTKEVFPGVQARSMGSWTRANFGPQVFTVGQYERAGTALDNSRKEYAISQPAPGTLEQRLSQLSNGPVFLNIREAAATKQGEWLNQPLTARYNGQHPETLVPSAQYDAVVMLPNVTPPHFLY